MRNLRAGCILFVATISLCFCQRAPVITFISDDQSVNVGGTVEIGCSVQYAAGSEYPVIWSKKNSNDDVVFISTGTSLVLKESRFALLYDGASATYIVLIKDVQETDAGSYQCEVVLSPNNKISATTNLQILRPPIISDNSSQAIVTTELESVQMECYASGNPTPNIVWRRENNALLPTGGSTYNGNVIKIHSVSKEDRGTYYCFADNGVGKGDKRNINLEIEFSPVVATPRQKIGQAVNYDIDLECHVEAYPPPQIVWTKDSSILSNGKNYKISNFNTADEFTDSTLRITTLKDRQFGDYVCTAVNKLGRDEGKIHLYETKTAQCPPACGQTYFGGSSTCHINSLILIYVSFIYVLYYLR